MRHALTIDVSAEVYDYVCAMAAKAGQTPEEWARERLESVVPTAAFMTPKQKAAAIAELMKAAGAADMGRPLGVNNEQIDCDLAEEYASTHEDAC